MLTFLYMALGFCIGRIFSIWDEQKRCNQLAKKIIELTDDMVIDEDTPPKFVRRIK